MSTGTQQPPTGQIPTPETEKSMIRVRLICGAFVTFAMPFMIFFGLLTIQLIKQGTLFGDVWQFLHPKTLVFGFVHAIPLAFILPYFMSSAWVERAKFHGYEIRRLEQHRRTQILQKNIAAQNKIRGKTDDPEEHVEPQKPPQNTPQPTEGSTRLSRPEQSRLMAFVGGLIIALLIGAIMILMKGWRNSETIIYGTLFLAFPTAFITLFFDLFMCRKVDRFFPTIESQALRQQDLEASARVRVAKRTEELRRKELKQKEKSSARDLKNEVREQAYQADLKQGKNAPSNDQPSPIKYSTFRLLIAGYWGMVCVLFYLAVVGIGLGTDAYSADIVKNVDVLNFIGLKQLAVLTICLVIGYLALPRFLVKRPGDKKQAFIGGMLCFALTMFLVSAIMLFYRTYNTAQALGWREDVLSHALPYLSGSLISATLTSPIGGLLALLALALFPRPAMDQVAQEHIDREEIREKILKRTQGTIDPQN